MGHIAETVTAAIMDAMAKKKKRKPAVYQNPRVVFHVPADLLHAVDARAREFGRTRTSELVMVLRQAYEQMGQLPPTRTGKSSPAES